MRTRPNTTIAADRRFTLRRCKATLLLALATGLLLCLVACGTTSNDTTATDDVAEKPVVADTPAPKTTLAIAEIAEGAYTGTLSGDSYTSTYDKYAISREISPSELTVTIQGGQVQLHSVASVVATGEVAGVAAPVPVQFTQTVSGTLPLSQVDQATVRAEGAVTAPEETPYINWDGDMQFTHWDIETHDGTYDCVVSITLVDGVPTADVAVNGSASRRTAMVPLALAP